MAERLMHRRESRHGTRDDTPRGMRRVVVAGQDWHWKFGSPITVRGPTGEGHRIELSDIKGMNAAAIDRAGDKKCLSVSPGEVSAWIARRILRYTDRRGFPDSIGAVPLTAPQPGTLSVTGPRGRWRWHAGPWNTTIVSPEGVATEIRTYALLGMTMEQWIETKSELIRNLRDPVKGLLRQGDTLRLIDCDVPGMPIPDAARISAWVSAATGPVVKPNRTLRPPSVPPISR